MENNFREQLMRIQKLEATYVIFCQGTKLPFITCDEETFNDQVWVFVSEEQSKAFGQKRLEENQDVLMVARLTNNQLLKFYSSLYLLGINEVVFVEEEKTTKIPLERLVKEPEYTKLPKGKRPLTNPQMQLTGLYFMQELHRRKPNKEKPKLRELEEEMAVNMVRSKFLMALEVKGEKREPDGSNVMIPCVKNPEGKMFQPIFTDPDEFNKFNKEKRFQANIVDFVNIERVLGKNVEGIVLNPQSTNIVILKSKIPTLIQRFQKK